MQSDVSKANELHGCLRQIGRHQSSSPKHLNEQMAGDALSLSQRNGPKRRKLNLLPDKVVFMFFYLYIFVGLCCIL